VVRVPGYRSRGPGSIPDATRFYWEVLGLERGPLSLVSTTEELLERKSSGSCLESQDYGHRDPSRWPRDILYPETLVLTSPTSVGRSVGIVRSRTQATEFSFSLQFREAYYCWSTVPTLNPVARILRCMMARLVFERRISHTPSHFECSFFPPFGCVFSSSGNRNDVDKKMGCGWLGCCWCYKDFCLRSMGELTSLIHNRLESLHWMEIQLTT
jgi:hypothetical protein